MPLSVMQPGSPQPSEQSGTRYSQRHGKAVLRLRGRETEAQQSCTALSGQVGTDEVGAQGSACNPHALVGLFILSFSAMT